MSKAYQIVWDSDHETVVSSFDLAMRHIGAWVANEDIVATRFGHIDEFGGLTTPELAGSIFQRIRFGVEESKIESIQIIEHHTDAAPGMMTGDGFRLDLVDDLDPSYEIQRALYLASENEEPIADLGGELSGKISLELRKERGHDNSMDDRVLERLRRIEKLMGVKGTKVIPEEGDPTEILNGLPRAARLKFEELAFKAWPDAKYHAEESMTV